MNSLFVPLSILVKSKISEKCLINTLMNMLSQSLRGYLRLASIYDGNSNKKKTERILYGCITGKLGKEPIKDISINRAMSIFKKRIYNLNHYLDMET